MFKDYNKPDYSSGKKRKENRRREAPAEGKMGFINRRTFLKATAALGVTLGVGKFAFDWLGSDKEDEKSDKETTNSEHEDVPTEGQEAIAKDDKDIIGSTIEEQLRKGEKVTLNIETKRAIRQKWKQSYAKRPEDCLKEDELSGKNHLGLVQSMEKMQPWIAEMKAEFTKIGVPEKYAFLAIPESHFDVNANSRANAKGPFQFTKSTAKSYKLHIGDGIDQRCDPIASARACAEHLRDSYARFNNDWELAFADYNGGYTNKYAEFRPKKEDRNYEDYLKWREGRINKYVSKEHFEHRIIKEDNNITRVANRYGVSIEDIMKANEMKDDKIVVGKTLKIPATISVKMFKMRDSLENLNYPEKFYAVLDVMEEEGLEKEYPAEALQFDWKEVPKVAMVDFSHTVGKGEGMLAIARGISAKMKKKNPKVHISIYQIQGLIQKQNKISNPRKIFPGQKLNVKLPLEGGSSLATIARDNNLSVSSLRKINPSIVNETQTLSSGMKIRMPK